MKQFNSISKQAVLFFVVVLALSLVTASCSDFFTLLGVTEEQTAVNDVAAELESSPEDVFVFEGTDTVDNVTRSFLLPLETENGSTISYESSNTDYLQIGTEIITEEARANLSADSYMQSRGWFRKFVRAVVISPPAQTSVNLIATITNGTASIVKTIVLKLFPSTPTYSITYDANGADSGTVPSDATSYSANDSATILGNTGNLVLNNFDFRGWSTSSNGAAPRYTAGDSLTVTENITLYAVWESSYARLVDVPGGTFLQTSFTNDFDHTISAFSMGKYEVTYALWVEVKTWAESNGYIFGNDGREGHDGTDGAAPTTDKYEPVTNISWLDAVIWCNAYSEKSGYDPVYYDSGSNVLKDSVADSPEEVADFATGSADWTKNGYRLPSYGEWLYAAAYQDGSSWTPFDEAGRVSGDATGSSPGDYAWYNDNSGGSTHPVGQKTANQLGLHDMSGNVQEWIWYGSDGAFGGPTSAQTDFRRPENNTDVVDTNRGYIGRTYSTFITAIDIDSLTSLGGMIPNTSSGFRIARYK